jgi:hypothetical protein
VHGDIVCPLVRVRIPATGKLKDHAHRFAPNPVGGTVAAPMLGDHTMEVSKCV